MPARPPFDHFGLISKVYEIFIRTPDVDPLVDLLGLEPGQRLLDVGGGTGRVTQTLTDQKANLFVLDPSEGMLRQAQSKGCCRVCIGRSEELPFPDGSFDRVLAVDSFHHFWDYGGAAREMMRVVAPGGRIVIEEPDVRHFGVKIVALMERLLLMRSHFHRPDALASLFEQAGGKVTLHQEDPINYRAVVERVS